MTDAETKDAVDNSDVEEEEELESDAEAKAEEDDEGKVSFVEDPTFDVEYKGDCAYAVKVTVPTANTEKQVEEMIQELQKEADVPGFRRGKVPRKLIEKKFSKAVRGEADVKLVQAAFEKLVKDEDLKPLNPPEVDGLEGKDERDVSEPLSFTLSFEVAPRVELGTYKGLALEQPVVTVADSDIDEAVNEIAERYATFDDLEGGVAAEEDQVVFDFDGTIDGEDFQGGSAENYPYILGTKRFFPEFETVLLGSSPGDELKCDVTFPDDYFSEGLRGKVANFKIKVNEVKRRSLPELNDDFAEQAGHENLEEMRSKIAEQLREGSLARSRQILEARAIEAVVKNSTFELPQSMVNRIRDSYVDDEVQRLRRMRASEEQIQEKIDEITSQAEETALKNVKAMMALNKVGEAEGITVTEEDFEKEVSDVSQRTGLDEAKVAEYLVSEGQQNSYVDRVYRAKAMAAVIENAAVTDKEIERDELENEDVE